VSRQWASSVARANPLLDRLIAVARRPRVQRIVALLLFAVSVAGIAALIVQNLEQLRAAPWRLEPFRLAGGLFLQASTVAIACWLWADISHALGSSWDLQRDARVYAYSLVARRLPGAFWHVVGRAAYYRDAGLGTRVGVMGSAIEAGLLVLTGVAVGLATFEQIQPFGMVASLGLLVASPHLFRPLVRVLLQRAPDWLPPVRRIYLWVALDTVAWLFGCTGVFLQFDALYPLDSALWLHVVAGTTMSIVGSAAVVILPGGLGLRELGLTGFMSQVIPAGVAAALAIAFRISIATIEVLFALGVILLARPVEARRNG
jgi:hypothetical protein